MGVERIGVSLEPALLRALDALVRDGKHASRSDALRGLIREGLLRRAWSESRRTVAATVTMVYRHEAGGVTHELLHRQHRFRGTIRSTTHSHLGDEVCLEVLVVEGQARAIAALVQDLRAAKGVLTVEPVMAYREKA